MVLSRPKYFSEYQVSKAGVELVDESRMLFQCNNCGKFWFIMSGGKKRLPNGYYLCPNGCNSELESA